MGSSGGGVGGGGSGGRGGGGGGGGGMRSGNGSKKKFKQDDLQRVLTRLNKHYLKVHYCGSLIQGIVHELSQLKIDLIMRNTWKTICERLGLDESSCLADVRDMIFERSAEQEADARILDTAKSTLHYFFKELTKFDDDLLYQPGSNSVSDALNQEIANNPLENFLRLHIGYVIQREEPSILDGTTLNTIEKLAAERAKKIVGRLRQRYRRGPKQDGDGSMDQTSESQYLRRAACNSEETQWFIQAIRK